LAITKPDVISHLERVGEPWTEDLYCSRQDTGILVTPPPDTFPCLEQGDELMPEDLCALEESGSKPKEGAERLRESNEANLQLEDFKLVGSPWALLRRAKETTPQSHKKEEAPKTQLGSEKLEASPVMEGAEEPVIFTDKIVGTVGPGQEPQATSEVSGDNSGQGRK
ncbi:UNVERIFIED_CONTAM: hypothetical protein K2H54_063973, partial [Gekko kuhli]